MTRCYDLHAHSTASDGALSPAELVARARATGVEVLALTDHDTTAGLAEAAEHADALGLELVPGVEISVTWRRRTIHVLGLKVDPGAGELQAGLARLRALRRERLEAMAGRLAKLGIDGVLEGVETLDPGAGPAAPGRGHVARLLCARGHVASHAEAFKRYLGRGRAGYVGATWVALEEAVQWIRGAGGLAVIAHPAAYQLTATKLRELIGDFKACGGLGIEVVSGPAPRDAVEALAAKARYHRLLASRGSDFHSPDNRAVELGRLAELPAGCAPVWDSPQWAEAARTEAAGIAAGGSR